MFQVSSLDEDQTLPSQDLSGNENFKDIGLFTNLKSKYILMKSSSSLAQKVSLEYFNERVHEKNIQNMKYLRDTHRSFYSAEFNEEFCKPLKLKFKDQKLDFIKKLASAE